MFKYLIASALLVFSQLAMASGLVTEEGEREQFQVNFNIMDVGMDRALRLALTSDWTILYEPGVNQHRKTSWLQGGDIVDVLDQAARSSGYKFVVLWDEKTLIVVKDKAVEAPTVVKAEDVVEHTYQVLGVQARTEKTAEPIEVQPNYKPLGQTPAPSSAVMTTGLKSVDLSERQMPSEYLPIPLAQASKNEPNRLAPKADETQEVNEGDIKLGVTVERKVLPEPVLVVQEKESQVMEMKFSDLDQTNMEFVPPEAALSDEQTGESEEAGSVQVAESTLEDRLSKAIKSLDDEYRSLSQEVDSAETEAQASESGEESLQETALATEQEVDEERPEELDVALEMASATPVSHPIVTESTEGTDQPFVVEVPVAPYLITLAREQGLSIKWDAPESCRNLFINRMNEDAEFDAAFSSAMNQAGLVAVRKANSKWVSIQSMSCGGRL